MKKSLFSFAFYLSLFIIALLLKGPAPVYATELQNIDDEQQLDVTVGSDENGNVTVTFGKYLFVRKYNGWYIPATYIYNGSDLDTFLDSAVAGTRRTSVRCDGFLFVKMSGGWYRHELHFNDGRSLAEAFNKAAGITSTYNPNGELSSDDNTNNTNVNR